MQAFGSLSSIFPAAQSPVVPPQPPFFSDQIRSAPLPTNSFFQNYVLNNGDQPEYIHPYLIRSSNSSLSISYPSILVTLSLISQLFLPDLTISAVNPASSSSRHTISHFDDLSVTLDIPGGLSFPLIRGSPYVTCIASREAAGISISTNSTIVSLDSSDAFTSHVLKLSNGQRWKIYTNPGVALNATNVTVTAAGFAGVLRLAVIPDASYESILDRFSSAYPVSGAATMGRPFTMNYSWAKRGSGSLLLLAHPLHQRLIDRNSATTLRDFRYQSVDGDLIGVIGDQWTLRTNPVQVSWHSNSVISGRSSLEVITALQRDVAGLNGINTSSSYFYGKAIARAARLAVISEELQVPSLIPPVTQFLRATITPWLDGSFHGNGFLYEPNWGGLTTRSGSVDKGADFGFGLYNDHHFHLGYFAYASAVLAKLDPIWGRKFQSQIYALIMDYMSLNSSTAYPRFRNFDLWKLHSWAGGLTQFGDGRNQESSSEAVAAYYAGALVGLAFGDEQLATVGSTMAAFEIQAAQTWWHVRDDSTVYNATFRGDNRITGVLWSNKRESGLWFAPADRKDCRLGIQLLPILPITESLFQDVRYVEQLVNWAVPSLSKPEVEDGWKGFVYALQAVYDSNTALNNIRSLKAHDDGNSLSNLLWWIHSRKAAS